MNAARSTCASRMSKSGAVRFGASMTTLFATAVVSMFVPGMLGIHQQVLPFRTRNEANAPVVTPDATYCAWVRQRILLP